MTVQEIDPRTAAEIEATAGDLVFLADDFLDPLAQAVGEPEFGQIATEVRALAERVLALRQGRGPG